MGRTKKINIERIQLLATPDILEWWTRQQEQDEERRKNNLPRIAQDRLREAVRLGINILEGKKATVDPEKKLVYDALETLLRSGLMISGVTDAVLQSPIAEKPENKKKPKISKVRSSYEDHISK